MRRFEINISIKETRENKIIFRKQKAELEICDQTSFADIVRFMDGIKFIWKIAMKATRNAFYFEMEVIDATYENWNNDKSLITKSFDFWSFKGYNEDMEGIYLQPDTRYTIATRDMYLKEDIIKDLAFTLKI